MSGLTSGTTLCPVCNFAYVHIKDIEITSSQYGKIVHMELFCENGHDFEICLAEHKGQLTTQMWEVKKIPITSTGS